MNVAERYVREFLADPLAGQTVPVEGGNLPRRHPRARDVGGSRVERGLLAPTPAAQSDLAAARPLLAFRCNDVAQALAALGVSMERQTADALALWRGTVGVASPPARAAHLWATAIMTRSRPVLEAGSA